MKPISNSSIETNQGYFDQSNFSCFTKGLILSLLNPQAIPFWLVLSNFLQKQGLVEFKTNADTVYYILGVSLGTFVSLVSFAFLLGKFFHRKKIDTYLLNRFIGSILIGMAIYQLIGIGL